MNKRDTCLAALYQSKDKGTSNLKGKSSMIQASLKSTEEPVPFVNTKFDRRQSHFSTMSKNLLQPSDKSNKASISRANTEVLKTVLEMQNKMLKQYRKNERKHSTVMKAYEEQIYPTPPNAYKSRNENTMSLNSICLRENSNRDNDPRLMDYKVHQITLSRQAHKIVTTPRCNNSMEKIPILGKQKSLSNKGILKDMCRVDFRRPVNSPAIMPLV